MSEVAATMPFQFSREETMKKLLIAGVAALASAGAALQLQTAVSVLCASAT